MNSLGLILPALALLVSAPAPEEAVVKGRLAWPAGEAIPENPLVSAVRDSAHCLSKGALHEDRLVIHPKNRGIKNAIFFLVDAKQPLKSLPLTLATRKLPKTVELDIPCCRFEPRVIALAPGQKLVIKNPAPVAHAVRISGKWFPDFNRLILPEKKTDYGPVRPSLMPAYCACPIHPWMRGFLFAPPSPYFAVTDADGKFIIKDAPKGTYRLVGWHEEYGWVFPRVVGAEGGRPIVIKAGVNDIGDVVRGRR